MIDQPNLVAALDSAPIYHHGSKLFMTRFSDVAKYDHAIAKE